MVMQQGRKVRTRTPGKLMAGSAVLAPAPKLRRSPRKRRQLAHLPRWETPTPPNATGSYGPQVAAFAYRRLGLDLDPWQEHALTGALMHDASGDLIARQALWSTGRQNGKTVGVRALIGWMLAEGRTLPPFRGWASMLSAAHDSRQARIPYNQVLGDLANSSLASGFTLTRLVGIRTVDGRLTYDVATSQPGSQRGTSNGLITWDEVLTQRDWDMWEALTPTQVAQRSPLMVLTSTAGHADSIVLRSMYDRLVRIAEQDIAPQPTFYGAWWAASEPTSLLDWEQVARANPALDDRLPRAAIESEYASATPDGWVRERLNLWPDVTVASAYAPGVWGRCRVPEYPLLGVDGPFALGVQVAIGWMRASIVVAAVRPDGRVAVEVLHDFRGSEDHPVEAEQVTAAIATFANSHPLQVVAYDASGALAPSASRHALATGLPYDPLKPGAIVAACMDLDELIGSVRLAHNDPLLDYQLPLAAKRPVGTDGAWRWGIRASAGDVDAIVAMTYAAHAITYKPPVVAVY